MWVRACECKSLRRPELGVGSPQTGVTGSFEPFDTDVEQNLGPVQDQQVLLTADPFL